MENDASFWIIAYKKNEYDENEYLLINQKSINWNFWWFPKWHAENWEDWITAAKREFLEEVWISNVKLLWEKSFINKYSFKNWEKTIIKTVTYRIWKIENQEVKIQEEELNWYKRANYLNAQKILTHKNNKEILEHANEYIKSQK